MAAYAVQGYCPVCDAEKRPYGGRFFAPVTDTRHFDAAAAEWEQTTGLRPVRMVAGVLSCRMAS